MNRTFAPRRFRAPVGLAVVAALAGLAALSPSTARAESVVRRADEASADAKGDAKADAPAIRPTLEVFAQYALRDTRAQDGTTSWFHQFDVPRVWVGLEGEFADVHGRVILEGVRSASGGALIGVAGDSIVARVREAWAGYRPFAALDLRAGVVPTLVVPTLDAAWGLRALGPTAYEAWGFGAPADLGAQALLSLPGGYGTIGAAFTNGEGYASPERNRGKNAAFSVAIKPSPTGVLAPLALLAAYERGSSGTGSSGIDRFTGAALFAGERVQGLASWTWGRGLDGDGARHAWVLEAGVRATPIGPLLVAVRGALFRRDTAVSGDAVRTVTVAVGGRASAHLEGWLAFDRSAPTDAARDALAGSDNWQLRAVARVAF
jgi:hypothetical protein